ncbi:MAG: tRNA pseudouridine(38-40) synthase TruA [Verrucomicrobiia bacterium]
MRAGSPPRSPSGNAPPRVHRLTLAYLGTPFLGWQRQAHGPTVQQTVESALASIWGQPITLHGSGRTDTGVHARAQIAHFTAPPRLPPPVLLPALNHHLPPEIRVLRASYAPQTFHSRFSAIAKEYRYELAFGPTQSPFRLGLEWFLPRPPDLRLLTAALNIFTGTHDFAAFTSNPGYARASTTRTLHLCQLRPRPHAVTLIFVGDGFLYRMVRNLVGAAIKVARGRLTPEQLAAILASRNRSQAPASAPACGLYLHRVFYDSASLQRRLGRT